MGVVKIVVTVVLLAVILHAGDQVSSSRVAGDDNQAAELSESVTSFGASLYHNLTSGNLDNLVFSPLNTFGALAMTMHDADSNTKQEIMSVLSVQQQQQQQDVHNTMKKVMDSLVTGPDPDTGLTLRVVSDVYYNQSQSTLSPEYSQTIQSLYGQAPKPLEQRNPEAAINSRVAEVTDGLIPKVLQPGDVADSDNIFFIKGRWESRFHARSTRKSDFNTATGNVVQVPMMHQTSASVRVTRIDDLNAQVIEIPYEDSKTSFFVIMPDTCDGFSKLEKGLDAEVDEVGTKAAAVTVIVDGPDTASNSFTNVTETETRAAVTAGNQAVRAIQYFHYVIVNKPFIFSFRNGEVNSTIVHGRVVDPTQKRP